MELNFVETIEGKEWVAEFEAPSDFNLHIERKGSGSLVVGQRGTSSGEYDTSFVMGMYEGGMVIDYDFGALVYPKWIKVVSGSEVVSASVNFNEGGGSGSGSGSGENIEYYKINRDSDSYDETAFTDVIITCCAYKKNNEVFIGSPRPNDFEDNFEGIFYCAGVAMPSTIFKKATNNYQLVGGYNSWLENLYAIANFYGETADYSFLEPITKEEFYNLDNNNIPG